MVCLVSHPGIVCATNHVCGESTGLSCCCLHHGLARYVFPHVHIGMLSLCVTFDGPDMFALTGISRASHGCGHVKDHMLFVEGSLKAKLHLLYLINCFMYICYIGSHKMKGTMLML